MPKIADVRKEIATKQGSITKTESEIVKQKAAFKVIATAQQKAEADAKKEKDPTRKKAFEKESSTKRTEGEAKLKLIENLEKSIEKFEASITELEKSVEELEAGVAEFAQARLDYLAWWPGEKGKLDAAVGKVVLEAKAAEKALDETDQAVTAGNADLAGTKAAAAEAAAKRAKTQYDAVNSLIGGWQNKEWTKQRNLNAKDFGVDPADVAVHAGLAARAYATFKLGDAGRDDAQDALDDAEKAATEATTLAAAGEKNAAFYESLLAKMKTSLAVLTAGHVTTMGSLWGKTVTGEGAVIKKLAADITSQPTNAGLKTAGRKMAEQAKDFLPKTLAGTQREVAKINAFVNKEVAKVPPAFQRALKPQIDALRMEAMKAFSAQTAWETKYQKTLAAVQLLETALG